MNRIKTALALLLLALLGTGERSFADSHENIVRTIVGTRIACVRDTQVAELVTEMSRHGPLIKDAEVVFKMPKGCWFVQSSYLASAHALQVEIGRFDSSTLLMEVQYQMPDGTLWLLYTYFVIDYHV
jgi:hypothetical protein